MKLLETTPTKLLLGTAAASLAALGIAFVASSVEVPHPHVAVVDDGRVTCVELVNEPSPPPAPQPLPEAPRPPAPK